MVPSSGGLALGLLILCNPVGFFGQSCFLADAVALRVASSSSSRAGLHLHQHRRAKGRKILSRKHGKKLHAHHHPSKAQLLRLHEAVVEQDGGPSGNVDDALNVLPHRVAEVYETFQGSPTPQAAQDVLDELNVVYERAMADRDLMSLDCEEQQMEVKQDVRRARLALMQIETQLTALSNRMASVQEGVDQSLAEIEVLREQYEQHRSLCNKTQVQHQIDLPQLEKDVPAAKELATDLGKLCTSATASAPALVECTMPDGTYITTFAENALQEKVALLGGLSEKLMSLTLERALRSSDSSTSSLLGIRTSHHRVTHNASNTSHLLQVHRRSRKHWHQALRSKGRWQSGHGHRVPSQYCVAVATPPTCPAFLDTLATFAGGVEDLANELKEKAAQQQDHCVKSLQAYSKQVDDLKRQADDGSVALANAVAEQGQLSVIHRQRRQEAQDETAEADAAIAQCSSQIRDLNSTLCSARTLRKEVATALQASQAQSLKFVGDCVVGSWVRGLCSTRCGGAGSQVLTREVVHAPHGRDSCPALTLNRTCGHQPCPIDGKLDAWEEWSPCSRACGGGTRTRHRRILQEPQHGGMPLAETVQQEICNAHACDADCELSEWSEWSNCSKACGHGHRVRVRNVVSNAVGEGSCPDSASPARREATTCSERSCPTSPAIKCNSVMDVVLLLDVSGSMSQTGYTNVAHLVQQFADRVVLSTTKMKIAVVTFGTEVTQVLNFETNRGRIKSQTLGATYSATTTDTAQALVVAREMLEHGGRSAVQSAVVVFTDGMPVSALLTTDEARRLQARGTRIVFVAGGKDLNKEALGKWASWPPEENIVKVKSFRELDTGRKEEVVTELIANLCPTLSNPSR